MSKTFEHILAGTDFSPQAALAVAEALRLAKRHESRCTVLHAVPDMTSLVTSIGGWTPDLDPDQAARAHAAKRLDDHVAAMAGSAECARVLVTGKGSTALIDYACDHGCDLIVVGQTGVSGLERVLLGSTAERLLRSAPQAVLVVRADKHQGFRRILVPTDFSACAEQALALATKIAADEGAELHLLHVFDQTELARVVELHPTMPYTEMERELHKGAKDKLATLHQRAAAAVSACTSHIETGIAEDSIAEYAATRGCDLVVMGSVGRSGLNGLFIGNTAERVERRLACSLLTVKPPDFPYRR